MKLIVGIALVALLFGAAPGQNDVLVLSKQDYVKLHVKKYISQFKNFKIMGYIIEDSNIKINVYYKHQTDKQMAKQIMVNICDYVQTLDMAKGFKLEGRVILEKKAGNVNFKGAKEIKKYIKKYEEGVIIK
jgi:hypothetical protein